MKDANNQNTKNTNNLRTKLLNKINPNNKNYDFLTKVFMEMERLENK